MPLPTGHHLLTPTLSVHVFDADRPGPTAIIEAGIHGDEIAGVHAICELLEEGLRPDAGRLLLIPVMNPPAYRARTRTAPGGLDLNRCFPGDPDAAEAERRLAARFMALMRDEKPALLATLHESHKRYYPHVTPSFGQTLVYGTETRPPVIDAVVDHMNSRIAHEDERWAHQCYPVATSSTEVIVDAVGCVGICVETWMGFAEARRVEMQREVVLALLGEIGVLDQR